MRPDEQWGRSASVVAAFRTMTVTDARKRGDSAYHVLRNLAATIDGIPGLDTAGKRDAFDPWLAAVRYVYGPGETAKALTQLHTDAGRPDAHA